MGEKLLEKAYRDGYRRGFATGNAGRQWDLSEEYLAIMWQDWKDQNPGAIEPRPCDGPAPATTGEALEQRALRIASDLESRDLEAAEVLRALACRTPGPATLEMLDLARAIVASAVTTARVKAACAAFIVEHEPTKSARSIRGDSRTDDAGRWSGLESGVDT